MARLSLRIWRLFLVCLLVTPLLHYSGPPLAVAQEDSVEDDVVNEDVVEGEEEEDDIEVSDEDGEEEGEPVTVPDTEEEEEETAMTEGEEEEEEEIKSSPDVETVIIFTNRPTNEFVAGEVVHSLIGFTNKGESDFVVTGIEASFRYPQDFSYHIQNFTADTYETYIIPKSQASFVYHFQPSESFYARPFGLTLNIYYRDLKANEFRNAVFNDTVNIVEVEEGFDGETFFMYVFMVSGLCILMFIVHYVYTTVWRGRPSSKRPLETGTQGKEDVDYQWVPEGAIPTTPKKSPRASPRNRRSTKK